MNEEASAAALSQSKQLRGRTWLPAPATDLQLDPVDRTCRQAVKFGTRLRAVPASCHPGNYEALLRAARVVPKVGVEPTWGLHPNGF